MTILYGLQLRQICYPFCAVKFEAQDILQKNISCDINKNYIDDVFIAFFTGKIFQSKICTTLHRVFNLTPLSTQT